MKTVRGVLTAFCGLAAVATLCGCPGIESPVEYIAGQTGDPFVLADVASVEVVSPQSATWPSPVERPWK